MKFVKWGIIVILSPLVLFVLFILFAQITNYSPAEQTILTENPSVEMLCDTLTFSLVTWNIGYAGLDKSMDFFYDGGRNVRPSKQSSLNNLEGILKTLKKYQNFDFLLLEEVDIKSKRSYRINQYETIEHHFQQYSKTMGINYQVKFVPKPITNPLGSVNSGISIFSKTLPAKSIRYSFPGNFSWPMSLVMLDRCFVVNEYPLTNGKNLMVIVTHNSSFDDGTLRAQQMNYFKDFLLDFYKQGNYVIVGGDWNQCPNNFIPQFDGDIFDSTNLMYIDNDYPSPDWTWAYDPTIPTNRRVSNPYLKGETRTTVIDHFLCSPNIQVEKVNGRDLGFEFSDHQPVEIAIKLLPDEI